MKLLAIKKTNASDVSGVFNHSCLFKVILQTLPKANHH